MQSAARIAVSTILLTSAIASAYQNTAKLRRDGVLNLFPFPRVGRASKATWQVPAEEFALDYKQELKRQLYAFPRVGRGGTPASLQQLRSVLETLGSEQPQLPLAALADLMLGGRRHRFTKRNQLAAGANENDMGMWFGPRVGRAYKGADDEDNTTAHKNDGSEPELIEPDPTEDREKREATSK